MFRGNAESESAPGGDRGDEGRDGKRGRALVIGLVALAVVLGVVGWIVRDITFPQPPQPSGAATQPTASPP
jgi:hypothetical protein